MKIRVILLSLVLLFSIPAISSGQVGNVIRNRVNKALNKQVEEKIDTAINRRAQEIEEEAEQGEEEAGEGREGRGINLGGLMGGKVTSKYNESYSFNNSLYMVAEMFDGKEAVKMDYYIYWSDNDLNGGFESKITGNTDEGEQISALTKMIFDNQNKTLLMLTDMGAAKIGIISEVPDESTVPPDETTSGQKITKTGNTRIIAGYKCDEYLVTETDSKDHGKLWITNDLRLKLDARTYSKAGLSTYYGNPELKGGLVLAMESYNANNELQMRSETREIKFGISHTISTAGYALRQTNFNQAGSGRK